MKESCGGGGGGTQFGHLVGGEGFSLRAFTFGLYFLRILNGQTKANSSPSSPFVTCECAKAHEGDSWSLAHRFSAATVVKATEVPSLSFGDTSPNDHEGASSRSTESNRRRTTLLRGAAPRRRQIWLRAQPPFQRCRPYVRGEGD